MPALVRPRATYLYPSFVRHTFREPATERKFLFPFKPKPLLLDSIKTYTNCPIFGGRNFNFSKGYYRFLVSGGKENSSLMRDDNVRKTHHVPNCDTIVMTLIKPRLNSKPC